MEQPLTLTHSALSSGRWIDVPIQSALRGWETRPGPLYGKIASALRDAVERGELPPGNRLPPERMLACYLGVSRRTVARAYEALRRLRLVERRQGSGTMISGVDSPLQDDRTAKLATSLGRNIVFRSFAQTGAPTIDLLSVYAPTTEAVTQDILQASVSELSRGVIDQHGYAPAGYPPLRRAIAARYTAVGVPTDDAEILVTTGAQQAASLVASSFLKPGQLAVLEDPTIPGAIDAFRTAGARLSTVPVRESGADVAALAAVLARDTVGTVYLMPTYQSPTGTVMPEDARRHVVELAKRTGVPIVEDTTVAELTIHGEPPPLLAAYADGAPILSIGSLSKLFWAGLRVGWIRGPRTVVAHLARLKAVTDLGTSLLSQAVAVALLADIDAVKLRRQREMADKLERIERLLRRRLPGWTWRTPSGGLCLWIKLPASSALEFTQVARQHGVAIAPGTITSATNSFDDHLRLPFGYHPDVAEQGIERLATAWHAYSTSLNGSPTDLPLVV